MVLILNKFKLETNLNNRYDSLHGHRKSGKKPRTATESGQQGNIARSSPNAHEWTHHASRGNISARCAAQSARQAPRLRPPKGRRIITSRSVETDNAPNKRCIKQRIQTGVIPADSDGNRSRRYSDAARVSDERSAEARPCSGSAHCGIGERRRLGTCSLP